MLETAIIGAGPYGLSLAAHFRRQGVPFRIFGRPMDSWKSHMPKGMKLKSDGFASNLSDPNEECTLKQFCAERGIEYADTGIPVSLETFTEYGLTFRDRMVPELEDKMVVGLDRLPEGFLLRLDSGETVIARRVVLAVGITHFKNVPKELSGLPAEMVSHSYEHQDPEAYRGREVVVLGGGSSATDLAGLLHECGAKVQLVARQEKLVFHERRDPNQKRSLWKRLRYPQSGLGPGLTSRFCSNMPTVFYHLPETLRLKTVRTHLGPAGGWFAKDMVMGKVQLQMGCTIVRAEAQNGKAKLTLQEANGRTRTIEAEHVIAATGYKVDIDRLGFLSPDIRSKVKLLEGMPVLTKSFESSIAGLYFVGLTAANSFGPLMRFAYGAKFAASQVTEALVAVLAKDRGYVGAASTVAATK